MLSPHHIVLALLSIFLMGFVPVLIFGVNANEATIGLVRLAIATIGTSLILLFSNQLRGLQERIGKHELVWLALLGLVFAVHWYLYFWSIKRAGASLGAIAVSTFGIHLLFVNRLFFKEPIQRPDLIAVVLAFIGVCVATPVENNSLEQTFGFLSGVMSGFLYACLPPINQQISHLSTNVRALGQFGFAFLGFSLLLPITDWDLSQSDWYGLVTLGVVCTLAAHTLWNKVSTEMPGNFTAVVYYLYIPWAMTLSVVFLNEQITWQKLLGALFIVAANLMVVLFHRKKNRV